MSNPAITVWFDSACPLCSREIRLMRALDWRSRSTSWISTARMPPAPSNPLSFSRAFMRRKSRSACLRCRSLRADVAADSSLLALGASGAYPARAGAAGARLSAVSPVAKCASIVAQVARLPAEHIVAEGRIAHDEGQHEDRSEQDDPEALRRAGGSGDRQLLRHDIG